MNSKKAALNRRPCPESGPRPYSRCYSVFLSFPATHEDNMSITRIGVGPRMSQAVVHNGIVYLAGQVAEKPVPSVEKQTRQILAQIESY